MKRKTNRLKDIRDKVISDTNVVVPCGYVGEINPELFAKPIKEGYIPGELTGRAEVPGLLASGDKRRFPLYCEMRDNAAALLGEDPNAALAKAIYESNKD